MESTIENHILRVQIKNRYFGSFTMGLIVKETPKAVLIRGCHLQEGNNLLYNPNWIPKSQIVILKEEYTLCPDCHEFKMKVSTKDDASFSSGPGGIGYSLLTSSSWNDRCPDCTRRAINEMLDNMNVNTKALF